MIEAQGLPPSPLRRLSTAEQVANALREEMLRGRIGPGEPLREQSIAASLGVSRNTFREAMVILRAEGLINHTLHRGIRVAELDEDQVSDLAQARFALEVAGIWLGQQTGRDTDRLPWIVRLTKATSEMRSAPGMDELLDADLQFHKTLTEPIDSLRIDRFHWLLQTEVRLIRAWHDRDIDRERFCADHESIVAALEKGDVTRAISQLHDVSRQGRVEIQSAKAGLSNSQPLQIAKKSNWTVVRG